MELKNLVQGIFSMKQKNINNMNNIDKQYTTLLQDILDNGVEKKDRN
jgi:hypothetical protein